jgi:hypothetical protein
MPMRLRILFLFLLIFSSWLMFHTLSYDPSRGSILISAKAWSDFGWMLPLERSFSYGDNWFRMQNPFYPGQTLKYHFLFYFFAAILEKAGVRIDYAFNLPSILGFFSLLLMIYLLSRKLFSDVRVSLLSLLFFLFNGSLSFISYFQKNGWTVGSVLKIPAVSVYPAFGPWDGSNIAAIWNLNIYTNQRPLGLSLALILLVIYLLDSRVKYRTLMIGLSSGILIYLNQGLIPGLGIFLFIYFLSRRQSRPILLKAFLIAMPFVLLSFGNINASNLSYHLGFLMSPPVNYLTLFKYWGSNLGLHLLLIPLGWWFAPPKAKKIVLPLLAVFLLPNVFQFSPDIFNNHKLFNLFIILGAMFSAYIVVRFWQTRIGKIISPVLVFVLIFSGIIDLFALKNDYLVPVSDIQDNPDAEFFSKNTSVQSVVLNSTWFYHPASIAGRSVFNGYTYFLWAHGYDHLSREQITKDIYSASDKTIACRLLSDNHISYVELNPRPETFIKPNWSLWRDQFVPVYINPASGLSIYSVAQNCPSS